MSTNKEQLISEVMVLSDVLHEKVLRLETMMRYKSEDQTKVNDFLTSLGNLQQMFEMKEADNGGKKENRQ